MNKINNSDLVLQGLKKHKGSNNAITTKSLARKVHLPEREVRRIISRLVTEQKCLIASSVHEPFGFYLIKSLDELKECLGQYYSRIVKLKDRAASLYETGLKKFSKEVQGEFKFRKFLTYILTAPSACLICQSSYLWSFRMLLMKQMMLFWSIAATL